jgi:hypothetical protein
MKKSLGAVLVALLMSNLAGLTRADEQDAIAIVDKAIKALGGEEKLGKAGTHSSKTKSIITINGADNEFTGQQTLQGLDHFRSEFEGKFNDNEFKGVTVLNGDKGWRKFGENSMDMDADGIANEKRTIYLAAVAGTLVPLKGKGFKIEAAGEEKVGDKPAVVIKGTGPDGKDFKLSFDKESGLPVKVVANVVGFDGQEFTMESTYSNYKEFDGIKRAIKIESKRDGEKFVQSELIEFKVLDKVPPDTFSEPK